MPKCPYNDKGFCSLSIAHKCKLLDCIISLETFIILTAIKQLKKSE